MRRAKPGRLRARLEYGPAALDTSIVIGNYKLTFGFSLLPRQIAIGAEVDRAYATGEPGYVECVALCDLYALGFWGELTRFY